jgi:hypothetical protein
MSQRYPERADYGRGEGRGQRRPRWRDDDDARAAQYGRSRSSRRNELSERDEFDDEYGERAGGYGGEYGQTMSGNYAGGYDYRRQQQRWRQGQGAMRGHSYGDGYGEPDDWDRGYKSRGAGRQDQGARGISGNDGDRGYAGYESDRRSQSNFRDAPEQDWGGGYGQAYRGGGYYGEPSRNFLSRGGREQWGQHSGRGPKNYTRSDERVRDDVNDRLTEDPDLDASEIEVKVNNCEVTLSGTVDSRQAKRRAEDCADYVPGVRHVQNNLRVQSREEETTRPSRKSSARGDGDRA